MYHNHPQAPRDPAGVEGGEDPLEQPVRLQSYIEGVWVGGADEPTLLRHAANDRPVAEIAGGGIDFAAALDHARRVGGPALRRLTTHQRALRLKDLAKYLLERKEEFYALAGATGATRGDARTDIEGGIGTLFSYSGKGRREMPNANLYIDGQPEPLSRDGGFVGQHVYLPLQGAAVHINAFNFPCWGMLEKLGPTLLAGVPAIVKPASQTAYLAERVFRRMVESGLFPEGSLQLVCGGVGDLFDHLGCQDAVSFTGSAATGLSLKRHPGILENGVRFTMEADSLNASLLGPDATPGTPEFRLYVEEVAREMTAKAGQKCTAIRRAIVPRALVPAVAEALSRRLDEVVVGDPDDAAVGMGPLASRAQRAEVCERIAAIARAGEVVYGDHLAFRGEPLERVTGAFLGPVLLHCDRPLETPEVHDIEAFGPACTLVPYDDSAQAIELGRLGRGSLVGSVFTHDDGFAAEMVAGLGPWHGRMLLVNRECAAESTGHGSPLPVLVHGGPGRAGGGEEMGGVRGVLHYMQRVALQGSPTTLSAVTDKWIPGARRFTEGRHPFRKTLSELRIGDAVVTGSKRVTLEDIEHFAALSGDRFYAHMDEAAARANPFFEGRVAHGYFIVSAAAGLFVDPAPGPVLANYGLEHLRFHAPVNPGDTIRVALTCKQKTPRENEAYGEVRWDCRVTNQRDELVATYDVLTLVQKGSDPGAEPATR